MIRSEQSLAPIRLKNKSAAGKAVRAGLAAGRWISSRFDSESNGFVAPIFGLGKVRASLLWDHLNAT